MYASIKTLLLNALFTILLAASFGACLGTTNEDQDDVIESEPRSSVFSAQQPLECRIVSFTVDPPYANRGSEFTFTWATENAKSVDLEPGLAYDLPRTGSMTVPLFESNWIRLVARGPGGPVEEKIWVEAAWPGGSTWWKEYANELNSSYSPYPGPQTGHLHWTRTLENEYINALLVGEDGSLFVKTSYSVHCLSPQGYTKWVYDKLDYPQAYAVNPDGDLYVVGSKDGKSVLKKVHPNGTDIWEYEFTGYLFTSCYLNIQPQGTLSVWAGESDGCRTVESVTFIIDEFGTLVTQFEPPHWTYRPAILLGTYFVGASSFLSCLNFEGYELWQNHDYYIYSGTVTNAEGTIYGPTSTLDYNYAVSAFDAEGNNKWSYSDIPDYTYDFIIATDRLGEPYFLTVNHTEETSSLIALDSFGNLKWQSPQNYYSDSSINSLAVDSLDTVYLMRKKRVVAIHQGNELWHHNFSQTGHSFRICLSMDGTLYVSANENKVFAFRDKENSE